MNWRHHQVLAYLLSAWSKTQTMNNSWKREASTSRKRLLVTMRSTPLMPSWQKWVRQTPKHYPPEHSKQSRRKRMMRTTWRRKGIHTTSKCIRWVQMMRSSPMSKWGDQRVSRRERSSRA